MAVRRDIDDLPKNDANYTALTPLWFLERAAQVHPNRISVVHGSRRYTWHQTYQRCRRFASALSNHSIGPGHTVIFLYPPQLLFLFLLSENLFISEAKKIDEKSNYFVPFVVCLTF